MAKKPGGGVYDFSGFFKFNGFCLWPCSLMEVQSLFSGNMAPFFLLPLTGSYFSHSAEL